MDPSGHDLHNISMFMNTMWRVGCPYDGGSAKINPDNYNGDCQDSKKEMMQFAFDRYAGKVLREIKIGRNNWPAWTHAYSEYN